MKYRWNLLSEGDISQIRGHRDALIMCLQERYGYSRDQTQQEIRQWEHHLQQPNRLYLSTDEPHVGPAFDTRASPCLTEILTPHNMSHVLALKSGQRGPQMDWPPSDPFDLRFANHAFDRARRTLDAILGLMRGLGQHLYDHVSIRIGPPGMGRKNRLADFKPVLHRTIPLNKVTGPDME